MAVDENESANAGGTTVGTDAPAAATPWYRRPRNLLVLLVVAALAVGAGLLLAGRGSKSGSSGPTTTIAEYFTDSGVTAVQVRPGDPGAPKITLGLPRSWADAGPDTPEYAFAEAVYDASSNPDDPAFVDVLLSKLDGDADPAKILDYAPAELRQLPDYRPISEPDRSTLSGFEAVQLGGLYTRDGQERIIAQKTVVIPSPNGLFVLQMNADGPKGDAAAVQAATSVIDEQAKIVP